MNNFLKLFFLLCFIQISLQAMMLGNYFIISKYTRTNSTYQLVSHSAALLLSRTQNPFRPQSLFVDPLSYFVLGNQSGYTTLNKPQQEIRVCVYVKQGNWGRGYVRFERIDPNFWVDPNCGWSIVSTSATGSYTIKNAQLDCYLALKISDFGTQNIQPSCVLHTNSSKYSSQWGFVLKTQTRWLTAVFFSFFRNQKKQK